jgi:oxygen-dependent protoporphyrinogen oxidase
VSAGAADHPVAVVGGGIAGLSAAYELACRGAAFVLLEAGTRWGGVIRSERAQGFLLEAGPDTLLAQKPAALALARELGLGDRLQPVNQEQRTLYVLHRGRLHPLPDGMVLGVPTRVAPLVRTRLFSWPGKLRMAGEVLVPRARPGRDESIAAFFRRRLGQEALDRLVGPFLAGIHAGDPERLSLSANFPALTALETRHGSLIRGLLANRARAAAPAAPMFYTLGGGLGELVDALVARLPPERLRLRSPVSELRRENGRFVLRGEAGELRARSVVLALPPARAAALLRGLDAELADALAGVNAASTAAVFLGYRREDVAHPLDGHGLIVPAAECLHTTACSFFSTKFPGRAPEGHVLLRGFLGGVRRAESLLRPDDELVSRVHQEMAPVLGLRRWPVFARVYRWPGATPQLEVGHRDRVAVIERRLLGHPGLFLTGGGLRGTGIPDCVADGRAAASRVA